MRVKSGSNLSKVKVDNHAAIFGTIYQKGPVTRQEIGKQLGVTLPTVTTTVKKMLEEGIIAELPLEETVPVLGRKAMAVDFIDNAKYAIGVEWGAFGLICCITNLRGKILSRMKMSVEEIGRDYDELLEHTVRCADQLTEHAGIDKSRVIGAGFTTPGMVTAEDGILVCSSIKDVDWHNKPVRSDLEKALHLPVCIANHVRTRAIGQNMFRRQDRPEVYLYYFAQAGISCCVMTDGEPFGRGRSGTGDIGHTVMDLNGPVCTCGKHGCLQAFAGEQAVLQTAGMATIEEVVNAIDSGDEELRIRLLPAIQYMGISIANIINLLNTELVVIDCALLNSRVLRRYLNQIIHDYNMFPSDLEIRIDYIDANRYTGAQGACGLAIEKLFIKKE